MNPTEKAATLERLAAEIGEKVYIDIAKWHLYLSDAHLHSLLAERFFPMLVEQKLDEDQVLKILSEIPVKMGGGRHSVALLNLLPMQCQMNLLDVLEGFQRKI